MKDKEAMNPPEFNDAKADDSKGLFLSFMTGTGMHGFPNIANSKGVLRRLVWTLLLMASFGYMVYQIYELVVKYNSHPVQVDQSVQVSIPTTMPAITFCNINPVKYDQFSSRMPHLDSNSSFMNSFDVIQVMVAIKSMESASNFGWSSVDRSTIPPENTRRYEFVDDFFSMSEDVQSSMGYSYENLIVECTYNGKYCIPAMFTKIFNPVYGNCYVFNADGKEETTESGSSNILGLSFFIDQNSYVADLTINAGIRIQIHEPSDTPLPEDFGISIFPGAVTQIGMRKEVIYKTTEPFGKCRNFTHDEAILKNAYMSTLTNLPKLGYTQKACFKTCIQNITISECNCTNPYLPRANNSALPYQVDMCSLNKTKDRVCMEVAMRSGGHTCGPRSGCVEECVSTYYNLKMSQSMWPSIGQMNPFIRRVLDRNGELVDDLVLLQSADAYSDYVKNNFARVEIYFEDLNYHVITMSPGYEIKDLLADMGGQVGLWLGLSVLTIFEIVELFFDVILLIIYRQQTRILKKNIQAAQEKRDLQDRECIQQKKSLELKRINEAWIAKG